MLSSFVVDNQIGYSSVKLAEEWFCLGICWDVVAGCVFLWWAEQGAAGGNTEMLQTHVRGYRHFKLVVCLAHSAVSTCV